MTETMRVGEEGSVTRPVETADRDRVVALAMAARDRGAIDDDACGRLLDEIVATSRDDDLARVAAKIPQPPRPTPSPAAAPRVAGFPAEAAAAPDPVDLVMLTRQVRGAVQAPARPRTSRWSTIAALGVVFLILAIGGIYLVLSVHAASGH